MWVTLLTSKVVVVRVEVTENVSEREAKKKKNLGDENEWKCNFYKTV